MPNNGSHLSGFQKVVLVVMIALLAYFIWRDANTPTRAELEYRMEMADCVRDYRLC